MTRLSFTRVSSTRGLAAFAVLGIVALGGTSACASSATTPGGGNSTVPTGPVTVGTPTPTLLPLPPVGTPTGTASAAPPSGPPGTGANGGVVHPSGIKVSSYTTNGTTLNAQFFGGVCATYALSADQSTAGTVRITIMVAPHPGTTMCPQLIKQQSASVNLGSPLDGRAVVDTADSKAVPQLRVIPGGRMTHGPVKQ
jgi:hypothetical protein